MDTKQLKYFLEIYKLQSFTEAAKSCFITTQGMHVSIKRLEEQLGCRLFVRASDGIKLTEAGEYLLPRAKEIVRLCTETTEHFEHETERGRSVSVLFVRGTVELMAMPAIAEFQKLMPDADVKMRVEQDLSCMQAVAAGEADLAVCSGPVRSKELSKKLLFTRKNFLVINKNDPLAKKTGVTIDDIKDLDLALPRENVSIRNTLLALCRERGFDPDFIENDEPRTAFNCAQMGLQAGIVNEISAGKLVREYGNTAIIPFREPEMNWEVYLVKRKDASHTRAVSMLETCLLKRAKEI
jgi:DNA-binding transcriptional LysR family regulator